jgi:uncharacterized membrane protein YidH (DUF202 family)
MTIPAVITVHVFRSADRVLSTFNFHPVYMSIGYLFLATQAMLFLYFNTDNVIKHTTEDTDRKSKVRIHTWINLTSTLLIALGFIAILYHKIALDKRHFATYHSIFGLITVILSAVQLLLGLYIYLRTPSKPPSSATFPANITEIQWRKYHRWLGLLSYAMAILTIAMGFYSNYAIRSFPALVRSVNTVAVLLLGVGFTVLGLRLKLPAFLKNNASVATEPTPIKD